jgi:hypothetical protein
MAANVLDLLSGILRYFPNTMVATLLVGGIALGRVSWLLVAIGGILAAIAALTLQYALFKSFNLGPMPGAAVLEMCSILPAASGAYLTLPSLWMTMTSFFVTYILTNASVVYSTAPAQATSTALPVLQRKGVGLISMLAVTLLFLFVAVPRFMTGCETVAGSLTGVGLGAVLGWAWWSVLNAGGPDVYPDIHGVMAGLKPGALHKSPMACRPKT